MVRRNSFKRFTANKAYKSILLLRQWREFPMQVKEVHIAALCSRVFLFRFYISQVVGTVPPFAAVHKT